MEMAPLSLSSKMVQSTYSFCGDGITDPTEVTREAAGTSEDTVEIIISPPEEPTEEPEVTTAAPVATTTEPVTPPTVPVTPQTNM